MFSGGRKMQIIKYLFVLTCIFIASNVFASPPNIVMIITDDQGYGDVSYNLSSSDLITTNIDALAAEGIQFTNFYSNSPVCSPTRASILTGQNSGKVGVPGVIRSTLSNSWGFFSPSAATLPELLRDDGYFTGHIGKWHLGLESPNLPNERGYDYFHGYLDGSMSDYCTHLKNGVDYMRENNQLTNHTGVHATRLFTQWAIDFIEERTQSGQPYFLTLWYNAPHVPIQPPHESNTSGCPVDLNLPEDRSVLIKLIEDLDDQIGNVIQALKDSGTYNNTLIIFASDNGGQLNIGANNGLYRGGKSEVYDGGIRVPMIATWPNVISPQLVSDSVAMTMDLFPTILEAAGAPVPNGIDGVSLLPILQQTSIPNLNRSSIWEQLGRKKISQGNFALSRNYALRKDNWKLVKKDPTLDNNSNNFELYNVAPNQDPYETLDQCSTNSSKCSELQSLLAEFINQEQLIPWRSSIPYLSVPYKAGAIIEAEDFDKYLVEDALVASEGSGYHDQEPNNVLSGNYRPNEGVDIQQSNSASNGFNVGSARPGEWLAYSINTVTAGNYRVQIRVAAPNPGGMFHIEVAGVNISGPIIVPATGGWQNWETIETPIFQLPAGTQLMRVLLDTSQQNSRSVANFDWFKLILEDDPTPQSSTYEVENLTIADSDGTTTDQINSRPEATNGTYFLYNSDAIGEFITFELPISATGSHDIDVQYHLNRFRGTFEVHVADALAGPYNLIGTMNNTISNTSNSFPTLAMTTSFASSGTKYLRFTVTGANPSTGREKIGLDTIVVTGSGGGGNNPPTVTNPGNQTNTINDSVNLQIQANDPDGDTLTYSDSGLPNGLSINSTTGLITGTATTANTFNPTITVDDGNGGMDSTSFTWTVNTSGGGSSVTYEVENLSVADSDGTTNSSIRSKDGATNGTYFLYNSDAIGEFITFELPISATGSHDIDVQYHLNRFRGTFEVHVAEALAGPYTLIGTMNNTISNTSNSFPTLAMTTSFASSGTKYLRFTVTGANPSTGREKIGLDTIVVTEN